MQESELFNLVSVVAGFSTVMLLLAILVTTMVQGASHFLALRMRVLRRGLEDLIAQVYEIPDQRNNTWFFWFRNRVLDTWDFFCPWWLPNRGNRYGKKKKGPDIPRDIVSKMMDGQPLTSIGVSQPSTWMEKDDFEMLLRSGLKRRENEKAAQDAVNDAVNKASSSASHAAALVELKPVYDAVSGKKEVKGKASGEKGAKSDPHKEIKEALKSLIDETATGLEDQARANLDDNQLVTDALLWFKRMERRTTQRFTQLTRVLSVVFTILVVIVFQVDALKLWKDLSTNPAQLARVLAISEELVAEGSDSASAGGSGVPGTAVVSWSAVTDDAVDTLMAEYPHLVEEIEEVIGRSNSRARIVGELELALDGSDEGGVVVERFETLIDHGHAELFQAALAEAGVTVSRLEAIGLNPIGTWREFKRLFRGNTILGLLMATVLVSLGAPFWFNVLQKSLSLRDRLKDGADNAG